MTPLKTIAPLGFIITPALFEETRYLYFFSLFGIYFFVRQYVHYTVILCMTCAFLMSTIEKQRGELNNLRD